MSLLTNTIDAFLIHDEFREQRQQQSTHPFISASSLTLSMDNMSEISLFNIENQDLNYNVHTMTSDFEITTLTYKITLGIIFICLCLLTISGNLLVLITFRRIRTVGNLFILSLATADLIVGCFVMPIAGLYALTENWNMGLMLCQIWLSVDFTASTASIFNLLTLSLDRYWSITSPLQYLGKRTRARALLLIGFAWGLSLLWVIPIFGWHHLLNNGTRNIDSKKCEPEYTHSKVFKVSTAIINFYLPLLVLICLNGRIYYEIKRRYKSVLLQRHANKLNESSSNQKITPSSRLSRTPLTMTLCDSDRQLCSTTVNLTENDSLIVPKRSPIKTEHHPTLRINFKDRRNQQTNLSNQISDSHRSSLKRAYSYLDNSHCTQDDLTWASNHYQHSRSSLNPTTTIKLHSYRIDCKHRLRVDERCLKHHMHDYQSCRFYPKEHFQGLAKDIHNPYKYQQQPLLHCPLPNTMRRSTTLNIFNPYNCCSTVLSSATIHTNVEPSMNATTRLSSSSMSSLTTRKHHGTSNYNLDSTAITSNGLTRSNSYLNGRTTNKTKQTTIWNQQEKAFRQLFAIVFGFTCCFLPYFILYMVVAFCGSCVSERVLTTTIWLGYVNSTMNPFLYALSNKHFRRTFNRIFKRDHRRPSTYN